MLEGEIMTDRNLIEVLSLIEELVPELKGRFDSIIDSIRYAPPELLVMWWREAAMQLSAEVPESHPKFEEVLAIWLSSQEK
jgi:hypothetical protein